jgi:hypothetical protein
MSGSTKTSAVSEPNVNSRPTEDESEASGQVSTKEEIAFDVEVLARPKQRERIPRSQRRAILANIAIVSAIADVFEYSNGKKWLITTMVALAGTISSVKSSILYPKYLKRLSPG